MNMVSVVYLDFKRCRFCNIKKNTETHKYHFKNKSFKKTKEGLSFKYCHFKYFV